MIIESWQELDHIALCCIGLALSWREPKLRAVAATYLAIIAGFTMLAKPPSEYGWDWFLVCSVIETGIIFCLYGLNRKAAYLVSGISLINLAAHLGMYWRIWPDYSWYTSLVTTGEYAQAGVIIVLSPPIVAVGHRFRSREKEHTWLARTSIG